MINNKEQVPLEHYLEIYRDADPEEIAQRTGVRWDPEAKCFTLTFLHREYEVSWPALTIKVLDHEKLYAPPEASAQAKIFILRYLLEGSQIPSGGAFLTYREVPWGEVYYRQFNGRCMKRLEFGYGTSPEKLERFRNGMEAFGARAVGGADAAYEYEILPGYRVRFMIWQGDEEFPPSSQILFSDNFAAAFHAEDLVVVSEIMINALKQQ